MSCDYGTLPHIGIQSLSPYVPGKSIEEVTQASGPSNIIKLGSNENALGCSPQVIDALHQLDPLTLARYPAGIHHPFHQQLSDFLQIPSTMLTLGNGSDSLFGLLLICFALKNDKHVITHDYAFNSYRIQAQSLGIERVLLAMANWQVSVEAVITACTPKTALIFIDNPGNPIGAFLDFAAIEQILSNIPQTTLLVLDEAYYEFLAPGSMPTIQLLQKYRNLIITRTFSKAYGLAGLRLGYAIADPQITAVLRKVHLPFSTNILALEGARAAIQDQTFIEQSRNHVLAERQMMTQCLDTHQIRYIPPTSNFITMHCGYSRATDVAKQLEKQGIITRPLAAYGLDAYLRVTVGTQEQNQRFLQAMSNPS